MNLILKPINEEFFIYSSSLNEAVFLTKLQELFENTKGLQLTPNLTGKLLGNNLFEVEAKWQIGGGIGITNYTHFDTKILGKVLKEKNGITLIKIILQPHSLIVTFFYILPLFLLAIYFTTEKELRTGNYIIGNIAICVFGSLLLILMAYFSKKRLRERFEKYFNLTEIY